MYWDLITHMLLRRFFIVILVYIVSFVWYGVFASEADTEYTEFYFLSWVESYPTIQVDATWWETSSAVYVIENKSSSTLGVKMTFVDSMISDDWNNLRFCKSDLENEEFGQYVSIDDDSFSISAWVTATGELSLDFPAWYSGLYYGCVVYQPITTEWGSHVNTVPRKAIFLDVDVVPTASTLNVKVFPSNRYAPWYRWSYWKLLFYLEWDSNTVVYSGFVTTNTDGLWTYIEDLESWTYDIVYKWQSHLASYLSSVAIIWWEINTLDFTQWSNLSGTITEWSDEYQIAWDLKNIDWYYDGEVNVWDITVLIWSLEYGESSDQYSEYNLNGDSIVNNIDLSVIIANFWLRWIYYESDSLFGWFDW